LDTYWVRPNFTGYNKQSFFVVSEDAQVFKWVTVNNTIQGFKKLDVTPSQVELICDQVNIGYIDVFALSEDWLRFKKSLKPMNSLS
jgi:hypothetical protein